MITKQNVTSDLEIIALIEQNHPMGWKHLYDKYALTMYVAVLWVVDDEIFAKNMLNQLFFQLKVDKTLLSTKRTLSASLLHYTYVTTYKMLRADNIVRKNERHYNELFESLNDFVYKPSVFVNVPQIQNRANQKGILKLCSDLNQMNNTKFQMMKPIKIHKPIVVTMSVN